MPTRAHLIAAAALLIAGMSPSFAVASDSCRSVADNIVDTAINDIISAAVKKRPELRQKPKIEVIRASGRAFLTAPRPDFKAYGYMMLLWHGTKAERDLVAQTAGNLQTPEERANFYFVMGLYSIRSKTPKRAAQGRDYIRQMKKSGHVKFVNATMWDLLIDKCRLAQ